VRRFIRLCCATSRTNRRSDRSASALILKAQAVQRRRVWLQCHGPRRTLTWRQSKAYGNHYWQVQSASQLFSMLHRPTRRQTPNPTIRRGDVERLSAWLPRLKSPASVRDCFAQRLHGLPLKRYRKSSSSVRIGRSLHHRHLTAYVDAIEVSA
jgi:hypothetical protein